MIDFPAISPSRWQAQRDQKIAQLQQQYGESEAHEAQLRQCRPCIVNGVRYSSCLEAACQLGIAVNVIQNCCQGKSGWTYYYEKTPTRSTEQRRIIFAAYENEKVVT